MSLSTITITKLNGSNDAQLGTKMALHFEQKQVCSIIEGCSGKLEEPTAETSTKKMATFKDWMNHQGVA